MAELEIDQSNLPRVQEEGEMSVSASQKEWRKHLDDSVCQCFAVLEDGALAHNLQEQEIEQYYTTNIQKNQLVQNDIRVAKRLQDEEDEQRAQQSNLLRQASRQLEEQDFEYARVIQEEIQRRAEEAQKREKYDEEIAKRLQEEEEQRIKRRSRGPENHYEGSSSSGGGPAPQSPSRHSLSSAQQSDEEYSPTATRWRCSTSNGRQDLSGSSSDFPSRGAAPRRTTSWSCEGHRNPIRQIRDELREYLSTDSEDSDTVFSIMSPRRTNTEPPRPRRASLYQPQERRYRSLDPHGGLTEELGGGGECWENASGERRPLYREQERSHRDESEARERSHGSEEAGARRCGRSESVRLRDGSRPASRDLARSWTFRDSRDKHVRFQEGGGGSGRRRDESAHVWEMLGRVLRERGVPVRLDDNGVPLKISHQSRDSQVLQRSEASRSDSQPHQRAFQRAATARHSFHGDIRERRRPSHQENSGRDHRLHRDWRRDNVTRDEPGDGDSHLAYGERRAEPRRAQESNGDDRRAERTASRRWRVAAEERLSSEEEQEAERRAEPRRRPLRRSQSLRSSSSSRASSRVGAGRLAAGASLPPEPGEASLELGELQQVLCDQELARKLQEEEEDKLLRRRSHPPQRSPYPEGDFRVAQVAQDEEIARFMQKQEIKTKRRSRELEGPASWREHRAMIAHHDRRAARERQRERLDSEGLPSPTEDCSPDNLPPSPTSTSPQSTQIRNIAEELDPTFQARRQDADILQMGPAGSAPCESPPAPHSGLHNFLEEPTFIPPTKRQPDKPGRAKPKDKKENCKQQ